jgi:hypothetical protein
MDHLPLGEVLRRGGRGQRLALACQRCGWAATPPLALLAAELGRGTTLAEAAARLACRSCGARPAALGLAAAPPRKHAAAPAA